ncbi:MAG TPA: ComF family protein [Chromatiales bacterium]|nr:ComF family protein [Thiotrichales bacterium]HIP67298.1 ComF family protein [Chromatiales bacterium]
MLSQFLDSVIPFYCLVCGAASEAKKALCEGCQQDLPWLGQVCSCCSVPLSGKSIGLCGACQQKQPAFDRIHALFHYQPPIDHMITGLKFHDRLVNAMLMGRLLAEHMEKNKIAPPDALLPVPLHQHRMRERGFNQALELARPLAKAWQIPLLTSPVMRTRATQAQMGLPARQRHKNIRGAFTCADQLMFKRVGIIDDVVTTGSTVNELARVLKHYGVEQVDVFTIARVG